MVCEQTYHVCTCSQTWAIVSQEIEQLHYWHHRVGYSSTSAFCYVYQMKCDSSFFFCTGSFLPFRVTEGTPVLGRAGFVGYLRWLLHSPSPQQQTLHSFNMREFRGGGMVASYKWDMDFNPHEVLYYVSLLTRWSKPDCLDITISAHPTELCVLELSGLPAHPQAVYGTAADHTSFGIFPKVHSATSLREHGAGYMTLAGESYTVLVSPGDGRQGHDLRLLFYWTNNKQLLVICILCELNLDNPD